MKSGARRLATMAQRFSFSSTEELTVETKKRIFCFPYAGGSSFAFRKMGQILDSAADLVLLDYPGHGTRSGEEFAGSMTELVEDIAGKVLVDMRLNSCHDCMFLGHSMGALVAYETARVLENSITIERLILCGSLPPGMEKTDFGSYDREGAFDHFFRMGWIPDEIRKEKELYDYFSEIIYSDVRIMNTFNTGKEANHVHIPLSIYYGVEDGDCDRESMKKWAEKTTADCRFCPMDGDHFFLFRDSRAFCARIIKEDLPVDLCRVGL